MACVRVEELERDVEDKEQACEHHFRLLDPKHRSC